MLHSRPSWSPIETIGYVFILISFRKGGVHELPSLPGEKGSVLRVESLSGYPLLLKCNGSNGSGRVGAMPTQGGRVSTGKAAVRGTRCSPIAMGRPPRD